MQASEPVVDLRNSQLHADCGSAMKIRSQLPSKFDKSCAARLRNNEDFPRDAGGLGPVEANDQRRVENVAHGDYPSTLSAKHARRDLAGGQEVCCKPRTKALSGPR